MPLALRNLRPNLVLFDGKEHGQFTWQPHGTPDDVQLLPDEMKDNLDIKIDIRAGIFEVVDGSVDDLVDSRAERILESQQVSAKAEPHLDLSHRNSFVAQQCMGPGSRGQAQCGETVMVRQGEIKTRPPLCNTHQALAQYLVNSGGKWVRAQSQPEPTQ